MELKFCTHISLSEIFRSHLPLELAWPQVGPTMGSTGEGDPYIYTERCALVQMSRMKLCADSLWSPLGLQPWFKISVSFAVLARPKNRYDIGVGRGYRFVVVVAV
eukprot:TRINITY_DN14789_c0_g1_i2.p1 TRINITY_DN14789_c0_g1~~TRINITY_DN14789_c0_g1_i2.p1  ORF type:complete len:105 (-),score=0.24 TRINITY_DN14789_c0_g1_i2:276-590(-)